MEVPSKAAPRGFMFMYFLSPPSGSGHMADKGLRRFYWTKWPPTSLFYFPLDLVRQETTLFAYPGTKPYMNQYAA